MLASIFLVAPDSDAKMYWKLAGAKHAASSWAHPKH